MEIFFTHQSHSRPRVPIVGSAEPWGCVGQCQGFQKAKSDSAKLHWKVLNHKKSDHCRSLFIRERALHYVVTFL